MIIGGPFTFLAGLFSLGVAGVSGMLQNTNSTTLDQIEARRQAYIKNNNYMPPKIQQGFEALVMWNRDPYYGALAGFDLNKMEADIVKEVPFEDLPYGVIWRDVLNCAIAKYQIEEVFHFKYNREFSKKGIPYSIDLDKWTHDPKYIHPKSIEYRSLPWDELIHNKVARQYYYGYYIFHKYLSQFVESGEIEADLGDWKPLPPPDICHEQKLGDFWLV